MTPDDIARAHAKQIKEVGSRHWRRDRDHPDHCPPEWLKSPRMKTLLWELAKENDDE